MLGDVGPGGSMKAKILLGCMLMALVVWVASRMVSGGLSLGTASAKTPWSGEYQFEQYRGRTVGGDAILYGVTLTISGTDCTVSEDGFQTMSRIACYATESPSGVDIKFKKYLRDNLSRLDYKKGDTLFSLKMGRKGQLITTWQSLDPEVKKKTGVYFHKTQ